MRASRQISIAILSISLKGILIVYSQRFRSAVVAFTERKKRREENLSRANALAAQGKHSQAREYYVKCVDVTPQMAYQLIKVRTSLLEDCLAHSVHVAYISPSPMSCLGSTLLDRLYVLKA